MASPLPKGGAASASTIARKHAMFSGALRYAVELGHLDSHPMNRVSWTAPKNTDEINRQGGRQPSDVLAAQRRERARSDFHPRGAGRGRLSTASDIDFVAVTDRRPEPGSREMAALAEAHARTVARFPRPNFDGAVLTWADLAAGPGRCPDVPCAQESRFTPAGRSGINPVTFCELAWHGIVVRGPQPVDVDLWADRNALRAFTIENLRTYWRPWWQQKQRPLALAIGLTAWSRCGQFSV